MFWKEKKNLKNGYNFKLLNVLIIIFSNLFLINIISLFEYKESTLKYLNANIILGTDKIFVDSHRCSLLLRAN